MKTTVFGLVLAGLLALAPAIVSADADEDQRAKTQSPVGSLIPVRFANSVDFGADDGTAWILNFQPVVPGTVGKWNVFGDVVRPDSAPKAAMKFRIQLLFPKT
jgi:hypothetical protein